MLQKASLLNTWALEALTALVSSLQGCLSGWSKTSVLRFNNNKELFSAS